MIHRLDKRLPNPGASKEVIHHAAIRILGIKDYAALKHLSRATLWLLCKERIVDENSYNRLRIEYIRLNHQQAAKEE